MKRPTIGTIDLADVIATQIAESLKRGRRDDATSAIREVLTRELSGTRRSYEQALVEALVWLYVEGKDAPYVVPYALQGDLWKRTECKTHRDAIETIREAVAGMWPQIVPS